MLSKVWRWIFSLFIFKLFFTNLTDFKYKKYCKNGHHYCYTTEHRGATHNICNLKYSIPKEIAIFSSSRSNYDYYSIIKELAEELQGQFQVKRKKQS